MEAAPCSDSHLQRGDTGAVSDVYECCLCFKNIYLINLPLIVYYDHLIGKPGKVREYKNGYAHSIILGKSVDCLVASQIDEVGILARQFLDTDVVALLVGH